MRIFILFIIAGVLNVCCMEAQNFTEFFADKTLRVDYVFAGNADHQQIYLDELSQLPRWAGRKHHLADVPLEGDGQVVVRDIESGSVLYKTSFSSLFQEWLSTEEAVATSRSFENTFLLPFPLRPVEVEVVLFDVDRKVMAGMKHVVRPYDILIHQKGATHITPHKYLLQSGPEDQTIDVAILAEGYGANEMDIFYHDAQIACESIFSHEPFGSMKNKFNVVAVASPSEDSGISIPGQRLWKHTAFNSHFDTFYSERYLTTSRVKAIHDALAGIPYEHIIILANTEQYGGGGIYNAFTLTTAHHPMFRPVVVHEFGHSFGGLADEYFYEEDLFSEMYPAGIEPWEQNITTLVDFDAKWKDMLKKNTPLPTPSELADKFPVGVYEGGGYVAKGIYRPAYDCRMRTNNYPVFCSVCQRALQRMIHFYTE